MTITQVSSKQDIINFFEDCWIVPNTAKNNEKIKVRAYSEDGYEWNGEDDFPLRNIRLNNITQSYTVNTEGTVYFNSGVSAPSNRGQLNNLLKSTNNQYMNDYIGWDIGPYSSEGTYTITLYLYFDDSSVESITRNIVIQRDIIAIASSTVANGRSNTSNLIYRPNKSRSDLIPGHTYQINGEYLQNNKYLYDSDIGTLEMLKCPTTTTISGSNSITIGESLTLTISIVEGINNTNLNRGYVTIYDGQNIVQSNYAITGNQTQITFSPNTAGTHDIYVIYTDSGVEYNTSTSNHLSVAVNKINPSIQTDVNNISSALNVSTTIQGRLYDSNGNIGNANVRVYDYDGTLLSTITTSAGGMFSYSYTLQNISANNQNLRIVYSGDSTRNSVQKDIPITVAQKEILTGSEVTSNTPPLQGNSCTFECVLYTSNVYLTNTIPISIYDLEDNLLATTTGVWDNQQGSQFNFSFTYTLPNNEYEFQARVVVENNNYYEDYDEATINVDVFEPYVLSPNTIFKGEYLGEGLMRVRTSTSGGYLNYHYGYFSFNDYDEGFMGAEGTNYYTVVLDYNDYLQYMIDIPYTLEFYEGATGQLQGEITNEYIVEEGQSYILLFFNENEGYTDLDDVVANTGNQGSMVITTIVCDLNGTTLELTPNYR